MKRQPSPSASFALAILLNIDIALLAEEKPPVPTPRPTPSKPGLIRYQPKKEGRGLVRVDGDGGSRGQGEKLPAIYVLAPKHVALTASSQPALFWYQDGSTTCKFELTITEPKKVQPILNLRGGSKLEAGIHSVSLARHKITLRPGTSYRWSVALVPDDRNRSKDLIAGGVIRYEEPSADLTARMASALPLERATIYAEAGYWYDSLEAISTAIAADPKNASLHKLRASLFEQGDLKHAAAAERK